jgi:hypothetical protein
MEILAIYHNLYSAEHQNISINGHSCTFYSTMAKKFQAHSLARRVNFSCWYLKCQLIWQYSTTLFFLKTSLVFKNTYWENNKYNLRYFCVRTIWRSDSNDHKVYALSETYAVISGVPRNFIRGGGVQQIQLRTERTGIWGQWPPSQGFWRQL